jgi:protein-disulfide isomerase
VTDPVEPDLSDPAADDMESVEESQGKSPALTIVIQSWATPIAALLMLIVGLVGGFFLYPVVLPERQLITEVVNVGQPAATAVTNPDAGEVMQVVSQQTKHFIGDEDAPVTIIEFSDFQ